MRRHPLEYMAVGLLALALPFTATAQTVRSIGPSTPNSAIEISGEASDGSVVPAWARGVVLINPTTGQPYTASGGSGGGGTSATEYAEDSPHSSGALGILSLGVRKDTCASLASADGDYASFIFDSNGRLCVSLASPVTISDGGGSITVDGTVGISGSVGVTGTFWQATQPVSAASLPLPTGAATSALQTTGNSTLSAIDTKLGAGINVTCVSGCGGGGGGSGDASAANQLTQIGLLGDIDTTLGGTLTVALPTGASTLAAQTDVQVTAGAVKANRGVIYDASGNPVDWTAPVPVYVAARNQGGCTKYGYQSAATNNATLMSGGAATLCSLTLINTTSTLQYFRIYDAVSSPTCSSATGFTGISIPVPASNTGAGVSPDLGPFGWAFTNGVAFCITGGPGSSDNTSATTGIFVIASYK